MTLTKIKAEPLPWADGHGAKTGWEGADLSVAALTYRWSPEQLDQIRTLIRSSVEAGVAPVDITCDRFGHPAIDGFLAKIASAMRSGPGIIFIRGLPVEEFTAEEMRIYFTGIGSHFGGMVSQSRLGDRLGEVTEKLDHRATSQRGYVVAKALPLHTDHAETVGLFCIENAQEGGDNVFVSSIRLYQEIARTHPEHIPVLERGFRVWLFDEQALGRETVSAHRIPIFSRKDGLTACFMSVDAVGPTADALGETLTEEEKAAIDCVIQTRERPDLQFVAGLAPGDAVFFNNYEVLHSRTYFTPWPDRPRHLFRLWLEGADPRPLIDELPLYRYQNPSGRQGIDPIAPEALESALAASAADPISAAVKAGLAKLF